MPSKPTQRDSLLALLERKAPRPLAIQDMARMLDLEHYDRKAMRADLESQVAAGRLRRIGKTRYQWLRPVDAKPASKPGPRPRASAGAGRASRKGAGQQVEGRYSRVRHGYGFVEVLGRAADNFPRDILIPEGKEGGALHGDRVIVEITRRDARTRRVVGQVVDITRRVHERIIGTLEAGRRGWRLIPSNDRLPVLDLIGDQLPAR